MANKLLSGISYLHSTEKLLQALKTHMCNMDSRTILGSVNRLVSGRGLEAITTAAVNHLCSTAVSDNMHHDDADHTWMPP